MKPELTVCGVYELHDLFEDRTSRSEFTHAVSIWSPPTRKEHREEIDTHLELMARSLPQESILPIYFDDIPRPAPGLTEPAVHHMEEVLAFARGALDQQGDRAHLLVHCHMGISRSTACAMAILAAANPDRPAEEILSHLKKVRSWMVPNPLLVRFADDLLQRPDPLLPVVLAHRKSMLGH